MGSGQTIFRDRSDIRPDDIRGSIARLGVGDRALLHQIVSVGGALDEPTHIVAYLYFLTSDDAHVAATELTGAFGYANILDPEDADEHWTVIAEATACLAPPNIEAMHDFCSALALRLRGNYDGWEAKIVKTNSSIWYSRVVRVQRLFRRLIGKGEPRTQSETTIYQRS